MIKLFSSLLIVFLSLSSLKAVERNSTINAVASFSILGDLVSEIGGKNVKVKSLVGPNGDAHVFQPTPVTNKTVVEADIVFLNGLNFEGWLIRLMEASDYKGVVVVATEGIKPRNVSDKKDNRTITDPHAWHCVEFYKTYAQNVAKGLEKIDPSNKKYYEGRLKNYLKKLSDLETWIHKEVNQIPLNKRKVITAHDAFGYFGEAYGIKFLAPVTNKTVVEADIVFLNGLNFEGWLIRLMEASDYKGVVVVATEGIKPRNVSDKKDNRTITDPHAWHCVEFYKTYAQNVAKGLEKIDPSNKKYYEGRLKNYLKKLSDLETWIHKEVNQIPLNKRKVITAHDAFGYFGEAYGIKFLAPVGVSTESKASAHDVSHLIEQIRSEDIRAVFIENISDRKLMEQIAEETQIDISENILYSDALSDADGPAANYLDMMHYNVEKLIQSMQDD